MIRTTYKRPLVLLVLAALAASVMAVVLTSPAWAATFAVTKTTDTNDGACDEADCSLREAIIAANAAPDLDRITMPTAFSMSRRYRPAPAR